MVAMSLALSLLAPGVCATTYPPKPDPSHFYCDQAGMLSTEAAQRIDQICFTLWKEQRVPLYVVTIASLADYGASGQALESYAYELFNAWGIESQKRNAGMLLLISKGDRKARIELGADWGRRHDQRAKQVMDEQIVPRFKEGSFADGIVAGVRGMDAIARDLRLPSPYYPWYVPVLWAASVLLLVGIGISLIRSGQKGWGWVLIAAAAALLFFLLKALAQTAAARSRSSGGFGGGYSGGGGASGSW